ncbi:MAG: hypothetical protein AB1390_02745 [Nitrospirota bacterium]
MRNFKILYLLIVVCALSASTSVFAAAGDVWISPGSAGVNASGTFDLEVLVNSGTQKLGAYQFNIIFNKDLINVDTTKGTEGVDAGAQGFFAAVNTNNNTGSLTVNGFDGTGKGPGTSLRVLIVHFKAFSTIGSTNIGLSVSTLADINGYTIGTPSGQGATVTIQEPVYRLSVGITPNNSGSVAGDGISCPGDCSNYYNQVAQITLTATPNDDFVFDRWSGCDSTNGNQCSVTISSNRNITAYFMALNHLTMPSGSNMYSYFPVENTVEDYDNPALCKPLALGNVINGTFNLKINIPSFSNLIDVYVAIYAPQIDQENLYLVASDLTLRPISIGFVPWKENTYGEINETLFEMDASSLPSSTYYMYLVVTPAGNLNNYYLWTTYFVHPTIAFP